MSGPVTSRVRWAPLLAGTDLSGTGTSRVRQAPLLTGTDLSGTGSGSVSGRLAGPPAMKGRELF